MDAAKKGGKVTSFKSLLRRSSSFASLRMLHPLLLLFVAAAFVPALALAVAAEKDQCSGHGYAFADSPKLCECFQCWTGPDCSQLIADPCPVGATGGNPLIYVRFWGDPAHVNEATVTMNSLYRTGYDHDLVFPPPPTDESGLIGLARDLNRALRDLHRVAGNAVTEGKYIVIGSGCTNLIAASMWAASTTPGTDPHLPKWVFAKPPYYDGYENAASLSPLHPFNASDSLPDPSSRVIEYVTYPNNPTGFPMNATYGGTALATIFDMVYYWPHIVEIDRALDEDVMMFSLSKVSGHAGTRFGWALVRDKLFAQRMGTYIGINQLYMSVDSQYRALGVVRAILGDGDGGFDGGGGGAALAAAAGGDDDDDDDGGAWRKTDWRKTRSNAFFQTMKDEFHARWKSVLPLFQGQTRFSLLSNPGTFYLWIKCEREEDQKVGCFNVFAEANITGWAGSGFGVSGQQYLRLEMVEHPVVFPYLVANLKKFLLGAK